MAVENVLLLGGSNEVGYGLSDRRGWAQRLEQCFFEIYPRNPHATFTVLAYPGDTSATFYEKAQREVPNRISPKRETLSILAVNAQELWEKRHLPESLDDEMLHGIAWEWAKLPNCYRDEVESLLLDHSRSENRAVFYTERMVAD